MERAALASKDVVHVHVVHVHVECRERLCTHYAHLLPLGKDNIVLGESVSATSTQQCIMSADTDAQKSSAKHAVVKASRFAHTTHSSMLRTQPAPMPGKGHRSFRLMHVATSF